MFDGPIFASDDDVAMRARDTVIRHISPEYAAGFFDGEGGIAISGTWSKDSAHQHIRWTRRVYIGNTDIRILRLIRKCYGGKLRPWHTRKGSKPYFSLDFHSSASTDFLRTIFPYLVIKKDRAKIYLRFAATLLASGTHPLPAPILAFRFRLYRRLIDLNRKGDGSVIRAPKLTER